MRRLADRRGFSIVEVLIATAVMSVVFMAVSRVLVRTQSSFEHVAATTGLRQYARTAFNRMTFEMRLAGYNLKTVPEAFDAAATTSVRFAADLDLGDAAGPCTVESGNDGVERVTYRLGSGSLYRAVDCWQGGAWVVGQADQPLASDVDVSASRFAYFDINGNELVTGGGSLTSAQRALIARVQIILTLSGSEPAAPGMPPARYRAVTDVLVRNAGGAY